MQQRDSVNPTAARAAVQRLAAGLAAAPRRYVREIRHFPDRWLHAWRRRSSINRLRRKAPSSVLVLCYGNICRSPYAARRLESLLPPETTSIQVRSAGFYESGRSPPEEALLVAAECGIEMGSHQSRLVTGTDLHEADLVIVMDPRHASALNRRFGRRRGILVLGDLDPLPIRTRTIRDPIDQPVEFFREVYARIDRCLRELVRVLDGATISAER